jgi:hypothetical protein
MCSPSVDARSGSARGLCVVGDLHAMSRHPLSAVALGPRPRKASCSAYLSAGQRAGQRVTGLAPFPLSPAKSARAFGPDRTAAAASSSGRRRALPAAARAPHRVPHGQQNAHRRLPPGGNSGGGASR